MRNYVYSVMGMGVTAGVLALTLIGFWFFAISEEQAILNDSSARLEEEQLTIRRMEVQLGKLKRATNAYERNREEIGYFRANFLQQKDQRLVKISRFLEEQSRARRVALDKVAYSTSPSREKDLEIQQISLPLKGKYRDIRAFIADIETSDLFLIISQLSLDGEEDDNGVVEVELNLATYFQGVPRE